MMQPSSSSSTAATKTTKTAPTPCCVKIGLKRGPWAPQEDELLANYIKREGEGRWSTLPKKAGLLRCGKSCRLRWMNYLRPSVKRGHITPDEEDLILRLHRLLGNRWSLIAGRIPGRTDNEIKNYWNTHLSKKLISQGIDPRTHKPLINPESSSVHDNNIEASSSSKKTHDHQNMDCVPFEGTPHINGDNCDAVAAADGDDVYMAGTVNAASRMMVDDGFMMISNYIDGEEDHDGINDKYCNIDDDDDDIFSSFLDSLINEDVYNSQWQQQQQQQPNNMLTGTDSDPLAISSAMPAFTFGAQNKNDLPSLNEHVQD